MSQELIFLGIVVIIIGFILLFIGTSGKPEVKVGFGGFVGPIPFGFANDPQIMKFIIIAIVIIAVIFLAGFLR